MPTTDVPAHGRANLCAIAECECGRTFEAATTDQAEALLDDHLDAEDDDQ